jgi:hypothetical protein
MKNLLISLNPKSKEFGYTGVTVVSSQPQSTTKPVIRPLAARANRLDGVNDIEGTWDQLVTHPNIGATYSEIIE